MGVALPRAKFDINTIPTDELLRGIEAHDPYGVNVVKTWLDSEGYYPGTTRVRATELYKRYKVWAAQYPDMTVLSIEPWGVQMRKDIKAGRGKAGIYYYISRIPTEELTTT